MLLSFVLNKTHMAVLKLLNIYTLCIRKGVFISLHLQKCKWVNAALTQQGTTRHLASFCNPTNHRGSHTYIQLPTGEVIQEEEWLCSLSQNIIHTHGYQVLAKGVVDVACLCNLGQTDVDKKGTFVLLLSSNTSESTEKPDEGEFLYLKFGADSISSSYKYGVNKSSSF